MNPTIHEQGSSRSLQIVWNINTTMAEDETRSLNSTEPPQKDGSSIRRPLLLGIILASSSNFQLGFSITFMNTAVDEFKRFFNQSYVDRGMFVPRLFWRSYYLGYGHLTESRFDWLWSLFLNMWFVGFGTGLWMNLFFNDHVGRKSWLGDANFKYLNTLRRISVDVCLEYSWIRSSVSGCLHRSIRGDDLRSFRHSTWLFYSSGPFIPSLGTAVTYQSLILMLQVNYTITQCYKRSVFQECSPTRIRGLLSCVSEICVSLFAVYGTFVGMKSVMGSNLPLLVGSAIIPGKVNTLTSQFKYQEYSVSALWFQCMRLQSSCWFFDAIK